LGASVGEVAGHEVVFLDAQRWGDVWWLTHHWENPAAMYSPLGGDIELFREAGTIVGVQIGGGTSPHGVAYTHAFASLASRTDSHSSSQRATVDRHCSKPISGSGRYRYGTEPVVPVRR
jgi:hypothetical protein